MPTNFPFPERTNMKKFGIKDLAMLFVGLCTISNVSDTAKIVALICATIVLCKLRQTKEK